MSTVGTLLSGIWIGTATHLWQTTLVLAVFFALSLLLRSAPGRFLYLFWWAALLKLALPLPLLAPLGRFLARLILPGDVPVASAAPLTETLSVIFDPLGSAEIPGADSVATAGPAWVALTLLWAGGAAWIFSRGLKEVGSRQASSALPLRASPSALRSMIDKAREDTAIPSGRIRISAVATMPGVAGLVCPTIIVPERAVLELTPVELRTILLHEDGHRRRRDPMLGLFQRAVLAVFFYYPPAWIVLRRLRGAAEFSCDERAARGDTGAALYAAALGRLLSLGLSSAPAHSAAGLSRPSLMQERFNRIREPWRYVAMRKHSFALFAGFALVLIASLTPLRSATRTPGRSAPAPQVDVMEPGGLAAPSDPAAQAAGAAAAAHEAGAADRQDEQEPLLVQDDVAPPELIGKVMPEYPEEARKAGIEGKVILEAIINEDGSVESLKVLRSVPILEPSALAAVGQWKYKPAMKDGKPVRVYFTVVIDFALDFERIPELERLDGRQQPVTLVFEEQPIGTIFEAIEKAAGLAIELGSGLPADLKATVNWRDMTAREALERLAARYRLQYEVRDSHTLIVGARKTATGTPDAQQTH